MPEWLVKSVVVLLAKGDQVHPAIVRRVAVDVMDRENDQAPGPGIDPAVRDRAKLAAITSPFPDQFRYSIPVG